MMPRWATSIVAWMRMKKEGDVDLLLVAVQGRGNLLPVLTVASHRQLLIAMIAVCQRRDVKTTSSKTWRSGMPNEGESAPRPAGRHLLIGSGRISTA